MCEDSRNPKISIVTICYNVEQVIESTLRSVLEQNYKNVEYLIIDGHSKDKTMDIVGKYESQIDVVVSEKDDGISDAFNKGVKLATGDLVCFLNAGDAFVDENVLSLVANDWKQSEVDVLFYIMRAGKFGYTPAEYYNNDSEKIWRDMAIPHQACFCRRYLFSEIGGFDTTLKIRMDYDFFARCVKANRTYRYVPKIITNYDDGGISSSERNRFEFIREGLHVKKKYGFKITISEWLKLIKWKVLSFF